MRFNEYPYLNLTDLNLDYILNAIKDIQYEVTNFVSINAIKYADPIQWNITKQYEKNTIVIDPVTGTAYISVAPVPAGVALTRPEYWAVVFDLSLFIVKAAKNFTDHYEAETTLTATFPSTAGAWLVWGDTLYKALVNITAGDTYVVGSNIEHFTIEDLYNEYLNTIAQILAMVGNLTDLTTSDKTSIVDAINELVLSIGRVRAALTYANYHDSLTYPIALAANTIFWWHDDTYRTTIIVDAGETISIGVNCEPVQLVTVINEIYSAINGVDTKVGALSALLTTNKTSIVNAINELYNDIVAINRNIGDLTSLKTTDKTSLVKAINEVYTRGASASWIFVADSFGETPSIGQDWATFARDGLIAHGIPAYRCHISGGSFGNTVKYLTALQGLTVPEPYAITDILVGGGHNDINMSQENISAGISNFLAYVAATYPNARVHVGINCLTTEENMLVAMFDMVQKFTFLQSQLDFDLVESSWYMHRRYDLITADGVHTTVGAAQRIAYGYIGYALTGNVSIFNEYGTSTFTMDSNVVTANSTTTTDIEMRGFDNVCVDLNINYLEFVDDTRLNNKRIATFDACFYRGAFGISYPITGWAVENGVGRVWTGVVRFGLGELYIDSADPDPVQAIVLNKTSFTIPFTIA